MCYDVCPICYKHFFLLIYKQKKNYFVINKDSYPLVRNLTRTCENCDYSCKICTGPLSTNCKNILFNYKNFNKFFIKVLAVEYLVFIYTKVHVYNRVHLLTITKMKQILLAKLVIIAV